jgi:hypothetical protein
MPSYRVSETFFYQNFSPMGLPYARRIEAAVAQLAHRYGIRGKSILSLGGGIGLEEFYFWHHGNRLTFVDIDEHGQIEPILKKAPSGDLHYVIDDANNVELSQPFEVLFMSGFTPDELRRSEIVQQRGGETFRRMLELNEGAWEWPWWEDPFHPIVMRFARNLRQGGTMIVQSYCGSLDALDHRYYLWACDRQLEQNGLHLRELYRFANITGSMLYVIAKGKPDWPLFPPLTRFHGRAEADRVQCLRLAAPSAERVSLYPKRTPAFG